MVNAAMFTGLTFSHPRYTPMIESKPAALPSCYVSSHSLIAIVAYTVEDTLPATPPAVSSGGSATLRLPLSIISLSLFFLVLSILFRLKKSLNFDGYLFVHIASASDTPQPPIAW